MGNPGIHVLSTPALVGVLDLLACECLVPALETGQGSVGTKINVSHLAATPVGMKIWARAEVVEVEGKRIVLKVEARDEHELIASGTIERYIMGSVQKFLARISAKSRGERHEKPPAS